MTEKQYQTLLPYIHITPEDTETRTVQLYSSPASNDSAVTFRIAPEKYPSGTLVDLNRADTTELKKIPGIGSGIARLIIGYRQRLGGFYNITQLQEIHLDTTQLQSWFSIDTRAIHLINLNRSSIERLRHHPYINFYQAKAFVEYRKKKGDLHSLKPFALYEEFSDTDLRKSVTTFALNNSIMQHFSMSDATFSPVISSNKQKHPKTGRPTAIRIRTIVSI